jgi:hypothetical protein
MKINAMAANIREGNIKFYAALAEKQAAEIAFQSLLISKPKAATRQLKREAAKKEHIFQQERDRKQARKYLQISKPAASPAWQEEKEIFYAFHKAAERAAKLMPAKLAEAAAAYARKFAAR